MSSFVDAAMRKAIKESGAELFLRLEIDAVGPTLNQLRSGKWKDSHAHRDRMIEATDKALGKMLIDSHSSDREPY